MSEVLGGELGRLSFYEKRAPLQVCWVNMIKTQGEYSNCARELSILFHFFSFIGLFILLLKQNRLN